MHIKVLNIPHSLLLLFTAPSCAPARPESRDNRRHLNYFKYQLQLLVTRVRQLRVTGQLPDQLPANCICNQELQVVTNSPQAAPATPPSPAPRFQVEAKQFCGRSLKQKQRSVCVTIANRRRQGIVCPSRSQAYDSSRLMAIRSGSDRSFGKILLKPSSSSSTHPDRCLPGVSS